MAETRSDILRIGQEIIAEKGIAALSFDMVARRLGRSKQAVLYWFPTRQALLAGLFMPWLAAEADAAERALAATEGEAAAIGSFVRAVAGFHLADLDRFRAMYLAPQVADRRPDDDAFARELPEVTNRLYSALAGRLSGPPDAARRTAVAIHAAVLGVVMMVALTEAVGDPLKHGAGVLTEALVHRLGGE